MSYEKTTWANGDVITAVKLNNMESGIDDIFCITFTSFSGVASVDKTYEEVLAAYKAGKKLIAKYYMAKSPYGGTVYHGDLNCTQVLSSDIDTPTEFSFISMTISVQANTTNLTRINVVEMILDNNNNVSISNGNTSFSEITPSD